MPDSCSKPCTHEDLFVESVRGVHVLDGFKSDWGRWSTVQHNSSHCKGTHNHSKGRGSPALPSRLLEPDVIGLGLSSWRNFQRLLWTSILQPLSSKTQLEAITNRLDFVELLIGNGDAFFELSEKLEKAPRAFSSFSESSAQEDSMIIESSCWRAKAAAEALGKIGAVYHNKRCMTAFSQSRWQLVY